MLSSEDILHILLAANCILLGVLLSYTGYQLRSLKKEINLLKEGLRIVIKRAYRGTNKQWLDSDEFLLELIKKYLDKDTKE